MDRTPDERAATIAGLRALADYLETNPDVPLALYGDATYVSVRGTDEEKLAEIDTIAALVGADAHENGTHYRVEREFGPEGSGVTYQAIAIPDADMDRHAALMSYRDTVTP